MILKKYFIEREWERASKTLFKTLPGSSKIPVMIIKHNSDGSCDSFKVPSLESSENHSQKSYTCQHFAQSSDEDEGEQIDCEDENEDNSVLAEYYSPNTVCAVAAGQDSLDLLYFIYILHCRV